MSDAELTQAEDTESSKQPTAGIINRFMPLSFERKV